MRQGRSSSVIAVSTSRPPATSGVPGVGVTWGVGDRAELEEAGAEAIVSTPPELLALLQESGAD